MAYDRGRAGGQIVVVFFGRRPIHHRGGELFPLRAFGAVVADAVAFNLPSGGGLVIAIFQDEAFGELLGGGWCAGEERKQNQNQSGLQTAAHKSKYALFRCRRSGRSVRSRSASHESRNSV